MARKKELKVIDIMAMIANGEDNFKFRVKDRDGDYGMLFEVKNGIIESHGGAVRWSIIDTWLNSQVKIESNKTTETTEERLIKELEGIVKILKEIKD